jgi:hypothetical protein
MNIMSKKEELRKLNDNQMGFVIGGGDATQQNYSGDLNNNNGMMLGGEQFSTLGPLEAEPEAEPNVESVEPD